MNLIRFLSVGKSLKESKDRPGSYKMESPNSIPKFEAAQRTLPLDPPASPAAPTPFSDVAASSRSRTRGMYGTAWKTMMRHLLGADSRQRRAAIHGQIELNLDRVTVMRNDLSDADIEVVARNSQPAKRSPAAGFGGRQTSGWMRLTQRLFRSHKDPFGNPSEGNSGYSAKQTRDLIART